MNAFHYRNGELHAEELPLRKLGEKYGTPLYVYSRAALIANYRDCSTSLAKLPHKICYAVKANSNLAVLHQLALEGAGFDVVSSGELRRVLRAGAKAADIVFSGTGKSAAELHAACEAGIFCINLESPAELEILAQIAAQGGYTASVAVRLNPDIEAGGHPHIRTGFGAAKFGVDYDTAVEMYRRIRELPQLRAHGIDCHIGSQIDQHTPYSRALESLLKLHKHLAAEGIPLRHINIGGGFAVRYTDDEQSLNMHTLAEDLYKYLHSEPELLLIIEPGRRIAASAGVLLSRILYRKEHKKAPDHLIGDAAMNDLIRPALYDAQHPVYPLLEAAQCETAKDCELVGPICESADVLGHTRGVAAEPGEVLAIGMAGAYGFSMSSQYNSRPRTAEVMVDGKRSYLVRRRERIDDLIRGEKCLPCDREK